METIVRLPGVITVSRTTGEITKHYEDVDVMAHKDVFLGLIRLAERIMMKEANQNEKCVSGQPD